MAKFDRVLYQKVFPIGQFTTERLGVEMQLDEGDDPKEILLTAKKLVEEFHKETNQLLYANQEEPMQQQVSKEELSPIEQVRMDIASCKEMKVLESYRLIVKNNPDLQSTYDNQLKQLSK